MSTSFAVHIPQMQTVTETKYEFVIESSDDSAFEWNFPNITDALSALSTCIGNAAVNVAMISGKLAEWHSDIAAGNGVKTKWRLLYQKI